MCKHRLPPNDWNQNCQSNLTDFLCSGREMRKLTIPFLGASGNSVHLAGMHLGTRLQVPLWQTELALEFSWNWKHKFSTVY